VSSRRRVTDFMRSPINMNGDKVEIVRAVNGARYIANSLSESCVKSYTRNYHQILSLKREGGGLQCFQLHR